MAEVKDNTVYISFNSKYKDKVQEFEKMLEGKSISKKSSITEDIDTISEFETEIGRGRIVVIFYCREYFKSSHCMNEYAEIRRNQEGKKVYTVKCDDIVFDSNFTMDVCRHWGGEKAVVNETDEDARTEVQRAERANEFYIERGTRYYFRKLNAYFRDKPYTDVSLSNENGDVESVDNLEQLTDKIFHYIEGVRKTNKLENVSTLLPCAILDDIDNKHFVPRDSEVEKINKKLSQNKIVNVVGIGGCGKSTIAMLYLQKYRKQYSTNITDIIINGDVCREFCEMYVEKHPVCQWVSSDDSMNKHDEKKTFEAIIKKLSQYTPKDAKSNLFVLDVNETADENDYAKVRAAIASFKENCVDNDKKWRLLVLSRVPLCDKIPYTTYNKPNDYIDISRYDQIEFEFIKDLFFDTLKEKRIIYEQKFNEKELNDFFSKLGNLPVLIKALAEYLDVSEEQSYSQIMSLLGESELSSDLKGLCCTSINKPIVYEKIGNFLSKLCRFSTLRNEMQKNIVRHMMLWEAEYFSIAHIKRFVLGDSSCLDAKVIDPLNNLEHKCWLDSRSKDGVNQYKMHSLIANTCFNQIMNPKKISFDEDGNRVEVPNPDYEVNEKYRDFSDYIRTICRYVCDENGIDKNFIELITYKRFDEMYYSWLDSQSGYSANIADNISDDSIINDYINNMVLVKGGKNVFKDFYIGKTLVTQELWRAVMGFNPSHFTPENDDDIKKQGITDTSKIPVESVSWFDCIAFIMRLNEKTHLKFRLPSVKEWKYAAQSRVKNHKYSWTDNAVQDRKSDYYKEEEMLKLFAWYNANSQRTTHKVATKLPNELGIYDMSGNVWEWCQDLSGAWRELCGGSWGDRANRCCVSYRNGYYPDSRDINSGMRLAMSCSLYPSKKTFDNLSFLS